MPTEEKNIQEIPTSLIDALFQTALHLTESRSRAEAIVYKVCLKNLHSSELLSDQSECRRRLFHCLIRSARQSNRGWFGLHGRPAKSGDTVTRALASLPVPLREILLLIDCQGFSYREVADILETSLERVAEDIAIARNRVSLKLDCLPSTKPQEKVGTA